MAVQDWDDGGRDGDPKNESPAGLVVGGVLVGEGAVVLVLLKRASGAG